MSEYTGKKPTFFGKVYNKREKPDDPRKVLSLDKREQREDGTWKSIRPDFIQYEDGSKVYLGRHLTMKFYEGQGNECGNCYFWPDDDQKPNADDFSDSEIPL